ncbi:MAG: 30S ribosome-binding factor RbfA [Betaproteobacteria bacterium]|nr:30S ribosome-binding factor RbfA [Betaproteobacteria bacterium]
MTANRGFSRKDRVSEQIRRELAELLRTELKDPRVGMISLTDVEVTADYAHAKVYFSTLAGSEGLPEVLTGLQKASGFLRRELGKRISIHTTPQLHFVFDQSLERGADLTKLIAEALAISDHTDRTPEN